MTENYIDKIEVDGVERPIRDTSGSVRYDAAQSLTDEQKAQARGNIDAAPGGFGLGQENMVAINDCNNAVLSGWYTTDNITANTPAEDTNSGVLCVSRRYDNRIYQEFHAISGGQYSAGTASRISYGDNHTAPQWGPWEWVNPPMILGTEYRTTERYLGKPVYCKVVNCGNLPDGTTAEVAHGIANVGIVVGAQAIASNATDMFNGLVYLPDIRSGSLTDRWTVYLAGADNQNIRIFCGGGLAGRPVYVTLKYTKTTD